MQREFDITERMILIRLATHPDEWKRPMDMGGTDGSKHSYLLSRLVKVGLAEKRGRGGWVRGAYRYRITKIGLKYLSTCLAAEKKGRQSG
jgi:hypothetical protein